MSLDIWTAAILILGVGIAATGLVETVKGVVRGLWPSADGARVEKPAYLLLSMAACVGLTGWAAQPIGVPISWAVIAGLVATTTAAVVYKWALKSFVPRVLAGITKSARSRIDDLASPPSE